MKYSLQFIHPYEKLISVHIQTLANNGNFSLFLPKWRPGRYELQNYDRCIGDLKATNQQGESIEIVRMATHEWQINAKKGDTVTVGYHYYANKQDAGGSYFDEESIYVNGINLFLYREDQLNESCELTLDLPHGYEVAGGWEGKGPVYSVKNFHELVDTPFFAGKSLIHHEFEVEGIPTHLWFQGTCQPDFKKIENDIRKYSLAQFALFGEFPVKEYHYLFLMLPYHYRHGVEHYNSTVIAMGPGMKLMQPDFYKSFLEISSHELFHTWNVKALRPSDMYPYDYGKENYSRLHYVTEGVTTYFGDLMIWKGEVWDLNQWVNSINGELLTHFQMGGKDFISLEEASFGSWTNGYQKNGMPNRRISFYTKGYLVSMLLDMRIRKATGNEYSLDDVMRKMYHTIAKVDRGYNAEDYQSIIEEFSGQSFSDFFEKYVRGLEPLPTILSELGEYFGLELVKMPMGAFETAWWGMKTSGNERGTVEIENLLTDSPALAAGLSKGDEIVAIEGWKIENNLSDLLNYHSDKNEIMVHYFHEKKLKSTVLTIPSVPQFTIPQFFIRTNPTQEQIENLQQWQLVSVQKSINA